MRRAGREASRGARPGLSLLWTGAGSRRARGEPQPMARAAPAGTRGATCGEEPRTRRALDRAECQRDHHLPAGADGLRWVGTATGTVPEAVRWAGNAPPGRLPQAAWWLIPSCLV